jgi:O-methyltransferase
LTYLYPHLTSGGVLIIDDYGAFSGCKQAVDEYQTEQQARLFLNRVDRHVRLAMKP